MKTKRKIRFISFGLGGSSAEIDCTGAFEDRSTLSGYSRPDDFFKDHADYDVPDGTMAVDLRQVVEQSPSLSFRSPMVDIKLEPGQVRECPEPSDLMAGAMAGNAFGSFLAMQKAHKAKSQEPGPLDSVSVEDYVGWWRRAGARIAVVVDRQFVWED